jgi:hypothetical protein
MFYWRLLERYAPRRGFGPDRAFAAFRNNLGKTPTVPEYYRVLFNYDLEDSQFIRFLWLLLAPENLDYMDSGRFADWPISLRDPHRFHPRKLSAAKICCTLDVLEEFSESRYDEFGRFGQEHSRRSFVQVAFSLFPYIERIEGEEKNRPLEKVLSYLSKYFTFEKVDDYDSEKETMGAVLFLLRNNTLSDETKLAVLERIVEKDVSRVLETRGPYSGERCWSKEPLHLYARIVDEVLEQEGEFPYSREIFSHQVAFIMEKARQYYGMGGYFSERHFDRIFPLLGEKESSEVAVFVMEVSESATVVASYRQKRQLQSLLLHIPPEKNELVWKAKQKIRRFDAHQKTRAEQRKKRRELIRALC